MEHNQSHSRESIEITHNRVKRSRLFLNAFMRTLRRANAISAPRKSATREFCKWRTEEHPRETKKNFERDDDEQRERERENAERNKKEKEGETLDVLSLFFLLPLVSFFANTRDDREQSRTFYVSFFLFWCCCCCCRRRRLSRGTREKSYDVKKFKPFLVRVFSIFSNSHRL